MPSIILFLSFFVFLAVFFIFVFFRLSFFSSFFAYILVLFPNTVPFIVLYLEENKTEQQKARHAEDGSNH
ncbi:hypothetical protein M3N64_01695 [Sporolactobacillus sp. CPB3-1]|uniref:Uncharacterized protein n=1 Tax=Sporolactobacillus mangiferae TaxID=2940498 RepID=A0ABT0M732_9BACL|nr:hypothetical protein [Sporolactobacillus mangiferae]MCL1630667.1 hypothetical protein [Sporolactobacillus mangiferae]